MRPGRFHEIYQGLKGVEGSWTGDLACEPPGDAPNGNNDVEPDGIAEPSAFRGVVRMKGHVWMANLRAFPLDFHSAGRQVEMFLSPTPYLAEKPRGKWTPDDCRLYGEILDNDLWTDGFGDKRTQLVVIGVQLDREAICERLDAALLTDEESRKLGGPNHWDKLNDLFFNGGMQRVSNTYYKSLVKKRPRGYVVAPMKRKVIDYRNQKQY